MVDSRTDHPKATPMTKAPALLPEGLRDRLPAQAEAASRVTRALVDAMRAHGYGRVSPPLAEFRETLGGDDERSSRDLLRFTDPVSQRTLALRPDITRQVGRIATSLLAKTPRPLRLCYAGQVVKLRASQLRPAREMLQVGAELIGSDSVVSVAGHVFDKPQDREQATEHLRFFSGREMLLTSAVALARGRRLDWRHVETARLQVRELSEQFIGEYLEAEWPEVGYTVGVFRLEGRGVQLFDRIDGDHFTIFGMPLVPLLGALREREVIPA